MTLQAPHYIIVVLLAVVVIADTWSHRFKNSHLMRVLPTPLWCYIPPTLLTTCGVLPMKSIAYDWISQFVLPACLILLLTTTNLSGLKKIGRQALIAMAGSTLCVILGGIICFFIFQKWVGPESWKATGTLMASWVGGTANQLAVKQATGLSDELFGPLFISDITMVYVWMTFLMMLSAHQTKLNRLLGVSQKDADAAYITLPASHAKKVSTESLIKLALIGFGLGYLCTWLGGLIPEIGSAVTHNIWIIILVTTVGLALSFTRFAREQEKNADRAGYFLLYVVLAATGAKANLLAVLLAPLFLFVAFVWMLIQGGLFFVFAKKFKIPIGICAAASQANLGGVVSAPIVASTYAPGLVSVGLILAILGNAIGNYVGIIAAQFLRLFVY